MPILVIYVLIHTSSMPILVANFLKVTLVPYVPTHQSPPRGSLQFQFQE